MPLVTLSAFNGANTKIHKRYLPDGVGVASVNQKPSEAGDFRPWRTPDPVTGTGVPAGRVTLYRMGRSTPTRNGFWLSWTTVVHAIRAFDSSDPTERTYYTGDGVPRWTDNILALAGTPYPTASRLLAVPQPTLAPSAVINVDGPSGDPRQLYYVFTWVNDIGWESAPSAPFLAPAAKPGAVLDLTIFESVPAGAYGVNRVRWYRQQVFGDLGSDTSEFFFLREYAVGAGGMQDDGRALTTADGPLPTETWIVLPNDASFLTYCWNQFAAAITGKAVRFCEPNFIYAWPIGYELTFSDQPLALAAFAQRLMVFTDAGAEICTGSEPGGMDQKPIRVSPIVSKRSLVVGESFAMWAAADGLWYYGSDPNLGTSYRNLVEDCMKAEEWLALVPSTIDGHLLQLGDRILYFGTYNDGGGLKGFVVDPLNPAGIYFLSKGYTSGYWDPLLRKLFVLDAAQLGQWDAGGTFMTATFTGKVERQIADTEGEWIELLGEGTTQFKLFVDDVLRVDLPLTTGLNRLPDGIEGRDWQGQISTTGATQGLVLD